MINFLIFLLTFVFYYIISLLILPPENLIVALEQAIVLLVLTLPFNINGNVFTFLGNARSKKNIYSLFSLYQHAEETAFALINCGYQSSKYTTAFFSIFGYQHAKKEAISFSGFLATYQYAGEKAEIVIPPLISYSENKDTTVFRLWILVDERKKEWNMKK